MSLSAPALPNPNFPSQPLERQVPAVDSDPLELTIVMPCLNEELTVGTCVEKALRSLRELGIRGEVIVSDNGSTDRSVEIAEAAGARVVHQTCKGYGNALRKGFEEAGGKFVIMGDADDSYDFTDLERFVVLLRSGADMVMGNRLSGEIKPGAMPWHHRWVGNPALSAFLRILFRTSVSDSHCGMRGLRRDAYHRLGLQMPGMEFASEMVIKATLAGLTIVEIPIVLWPDGRNRPPHLRSFRDGWRHLRFMLMCCPAFLFVLPGLFLTVLAITAMIIALVAGHGMYDRALGPNFLTGVSLLSVTGSHLMYFGFLAKLYSHRMDHIFADPKIAWLMRYFTLERGIMFGLGVFLAGLACAAPVLIRWIQTQGVNSPGLWILGATLITLGLEAVFGSFLIAVLELKHESQRTA